MFLVEKKNQIILLKYAIMEINIFNSSKCISYRMFKDSYKKISKLLIMVKKH